MKFGKNPDAFCCPREYCDVIRNACIVWAKCFRDRSDDPSAVVSVERFLIAADFSIISLRNDMKRKSPSNRISNKELWKWMLVVAEKVVSEEFFLSVQATLNDPLIVVKLPTFETV